MNDHDNHQTMEREIAELSALERMRKRAADDDSTSLRNIYLEETRQSTELSSIGYAAVKSSLYKRRRLHQPSLPSSLMLSLTPYVTANMLRCMDQLDRFYGKLLGLSN